MKTSAVIKTAVGVFAVSVTVGAVSGCSDLNSSTQPSAIRAGSTTSTTTPTTFAPPASAPTVAGFDTTLSGDGEWALAIPNGIPGVGCVTMAQLQAMNLPTVSGVPALQWEVIATPGHPHGIRIVALQFHKETASCEGVDQQQPRMLGVTGHIPFVPLETGTTTLTFLTDRCRDGGRYEIDVQMAADFNDENPAIDRQGAQLIVNCEFNSRGF